MEVCRKPGSYKYVTTTYKSLPNGKLIAGEEYICLANYRGGQYPGKMAKWRDHWFCYFARGGNEVNNADNYKVMYFQNYQQNKQKLE